MIPTSVLCCNATPTFFASLAHVARSNARRGNLPWLHFSLSISLSFCVLGFLWWTVQLIAAIVPHFPGDPVWPNLRSGPANAIRMTGRTVSSGPRPSSWILGTAWEEYNIRMWSYYACMPDSPRILQAGGKRFLKLSLTSIFLPGEYFGFEQQGRTIFDIFGNLSPSFAGSSHFDISIEQIAQKTEKLHRTQMFPLQLFDLCVLFAREHSLMPFKHCKERGNASETSFFWRRQRSTMFWPWV